MNENFCLESLYDADLMYRHQPVQLILFVNFYRVSL